MSDSLSYCRDQLEELYIQDILSVEPDVSRQEAKESQVWDLDEVKQDFSSYDFVHCENHPKAKKSLEKAKQKDSEAVEKIEDSCFVLKGEHTTSACAVHTPFVTDDVSKDAVFLNEICLEDGSTDTTSNMILHEAYHKDLEENPERWGLDKAEYVMAKTFGSDEEMIDKKIGNRDIAEIKKLQSKMYEKGDFFYTSQDPVFRLKTCMDGCTFKPKFADEEIFAEEI